MTAKPQRPRRQRKADRLLSPDSSAEEIHCDYAVAPMDRLATEMDMKWGIDRLPALVSVDTAARYGKAMAHLNDCIQKRLPAETAAAAENCIRGLKAMDAEAEAAGQKQATGYFWEYELPSADGTPPFRFGVLADDCEWQTAKAARPDLTFFTLREVANALRVYHESPLVAEVKANFPGSEITKITPRPRPVDYANGGDSFEF